MNTLDQSAQWRAAVRRLRARVNLVALLDRVGFALCAIGAACAFLVYLFRRTGLPLWYAVAAMVLMTVCCLGWGWISGKKTRFRDADARAFLDEQLGLYGALSASSEKTVTLPVYPGRAPRPYRWRSCRPLYWMGAGLALVVCGLLLPLPAKTPVAPPIKSTPPALAQVDDWITQLEQEENIEPESVERFRRQLDDLFSQSPEEMYTHSSLEAADALKSDTESAMRQFARETGAVGSALSELESQLNKGGEADTRDLSAALKALEATPLQPGGELAGALGQIDPQSIRQLDPAQMKQLAEQLKQASGQINQLCRSGKAGIADPDDPSFNQGPGQMAQRPGPGDGPGPGNGGVDRGRGDAPLTFGSQGVEPMGDAEGRLDSSDLSRAALGAQVGVQRSGHEIDPSRTHTTEGTSSAAGAAQGGDAVWKDNVTPREREALRKVFE